MDTEDLASRVEEWSNRLQDGIDSDKATTEAVNTFIVVAAFIAGVQAQVIAFTISLPRSALQRAANLFAFLGLIFEIAGTFLGAIHSILLQRRFKNKSLSLQQVTLFKADLRTILKWYTKMLLDRQQAEAEEEQAEQEQAEGQEAEGEQAEQPHEGQQAKRRQRERRRTERQPQGVPMFQGVHTIRISGGVFQTNWMSPQISETSDSEDRRERLQRVQIFFRDIQRNPLSSSQGYIIDAVMKILHELSLVPSPPAPQNNVRVAHRRSTQHILDIVPPVVLPMFTFGNMPLISMAIGAAFLATSTILLAAASQVVASEVWIGCTGVLLLVMALSLLPLGPWMLKEVVSYLER